jgi:transposase
MRKQLDGLLGIIHSHIPGGVKERTIFLFYNNNRDKIKGIIWDNNGFIMIYKRLEKGRFHLKNILSDLELTIDQFKWLIAGFDFIGMYEHQKLDYDEYL